MPVAASTGTPAASGAAASALPLASATVSAPRFLVKVLEEVVLPAGRLVLERTDAVQELDISERAIRRQLVLGVGILDDRADQGRIELGLLDADVGLGRGRLVGIDPDDRLLERPQQC